MSITTTDPRITTVSGTTVVISGNDIDTDRIIPARFLKHLTFDALGDHVFEDDRKQQHARGGTHPFDLPERSGAGVLLAAKNFGCGSSREHAAQALYRWGVRAVVGESFGEIFRGNCGTIGLPCVTLSAEDAEEARTIALADAEAITEVDLEKGCCASADASSPSRSRSPCGKPSCKAPGTPSPNCSSTPIRWAPSPRSSPT
ncbi:3-isopropylmalate dehydratase small subunit [Streptomyces sp. AD16]|nr:3-isopropylmalate dehydratase small subunit [Streptomyces albus]WDV34188.1 3-isopropylmalate dehydratase small subunit [Streptomyces sp. AD16]